MTSDEMTFVKRMLPHFMAGKSVEDCARAVLEDDQRIAATVLNYSYHEGESGRRAEVRRAISDTIYARIRAS